ncbi:hypothetical protein [Myxococcus stipitatus]|uniref:hypothetical protein n=1 Tax=Myxococcus stipitatus TaxID=83455 RepID=UPI0030CB9404
MSVSPISHRQVQQPAVQSTRPAEGPPRTEPREAAVAARDRDTFEAASPPASVLQSFNPRGRVRMTTEGDRVVLQAEGGIERDGRTPRGGLRLPGGRRVGGSFNAEATGRLRVEVPASEATDAIRRGQVPNPGDPGSWPVGTRATAEVNTEVGGAGRLGRAMRGLRSALGFNASFERNDSRRYELEKVNPTTVRATVTSRVGQDDSVGIRGVGMDQRQSLTRMHSADFDISSPQGREAYQRFLRSGELPTTGGPGVGNVRREDSRESTTGRSAAGRRGLEGNDQVSVTTTDDGSRVATSTNAPGLGSMNRETTVGPDGARSVTQINGMVTGTTVTPPGGQPTTSYQLRFQNPEAARLARIAFSGDASVTNGDPLSVNLTEAQARQMVERTMGRQGVDARGMGMGRERLEHALRAMTQGGERAFAQALYRATVSPENTDLQPLPSTGME